MRRFDVYLRLSTVVGKKKTKNNTIMPTQANESTLRNLSVDREAMKQSIRGLRANIEQLAGERERAENDSLEHTRRWQERAEELKSQGIQVGVFFLCF